MSGDVICTIRYTVYIVTLLLMHCASYHMLETYIIIKINGGVQNDHMTSI